jgi:hypothetical protein
MIHARGLRFMGTSQDTASRRGSRWVWRRGFEGSFRLWGLFCGSLSFFRFNGECVAKRRLRFLWLMVCENSRVLCMTDNSRNVSLEVIKVSWFRAFMELPFTLPARPFMVMPFPSLGWQDCQTTVCMNPTVPRADDRGRKIDTRSAYWQCALATVTRKYWDVKKLIRNVASSEFDWELLRRFLERLIVFERSIVFSTIFRLKIIPSKLRHASFLIHWIVRSWSVTLDHP